MDIRKATLNVKRCENGFVMEQILNDKVYRYVAKDGDEMGAVIGELIGRVFTKYEEVEVFNMRMSLKMEKLKPF